AFDNPDVYDKIANAEISIQSIINMIWSIVDAFSSLISCISAFIVISTLNIILGVIILVVAFPNAVFNQIYTKKIYIWDKENIKRQRESQYYYSLLLSKQTCQDIR